VRRNVYHNDRGGYVSSRHVCLAGYLFKTRESHQVIDFSSISGEFRFRGGPALGGLIIMNMGWRIILGRWKFLYHIDSDFTVLVKERKKSADLKLQKAKPKYRSPFFKDKIFWIFLFVCFITAAFFSSYSLRYRYITTKIWINGVSKWAFIILEWIADFLSEMPIVSFTQRKT
jgi:hypothetical protein